MTAHAPTLAVCMIVRDEQAVLPRCLASVHGLFDELCVVDTGSVDATPSILEEHGACWVRDTSCNGPDGRIADFARARNRSLGLATADWVLQIDADEVLTAGHDRLRELLVGRTGSIGVTVVSGGARWASGRLFRRIDARAYVSTIHEYLDHTGGYSVERDIVIENRPDKTGKESSRERNERLLRQELDRDPTQGRIWHYLGNEAYRARDFAEAATCFRRAVELANFRHGLYHSMWFLGCSELLQGNAAAAAETARAAVALDPRYAEGHCLLGDALYLQRRPQEALEAYRRALACGAPPADAVMGTFQWCYGEHPRRQIERIDREAAVDVAVMS